MVVFPHMMAPFVVGRQPSVVALERALERPDKIKKFFLASLGTSLPELAVDLRAIQELLGHSSLATTQMYTGVDLAHLMEPTGAATAEWRLEDATEEQ